MGAGRTGEPYDGPWADHRLTVAQAARRLGITEGAVRSRIKRGTLPTVKEGERVYVVWSGGTSPANHPPDADEPTGEPSAQHELVEELREQVAYLRQQLEAEREAGRRKDHLLAAALERIPAIEAPRDEPGGPETDAEASEGAEPRSGTIGPQTGAREPETARRPWWLRWFGG